MFNRPPATKDEQKREYKSSPVKFVSFMAGMSVVYIFFVIRGLQFCELLPKADSGSRILAWVIISICGLSIITTTIMGLQFGTGKTLTLTPTYVEYQDNKINVKLGWREVQFTAGSKTWYSFAYRSSFLTFGKDDVHIDSIFFSSYDRLCKIISTAKESAKTTKSVSL